MLTYYFHKCGCDIWPVTLRKGCRPSLGTGPSFDSVWLFLVPHIGAWAWHLKCAKHTGCNSDVVQCRIYVRTEDRWAEGNGWEGVSQGVVEILMNICVLEMTGNWVNSWATVSFWGKTLLHDFDYYSL